MRPCTTYELGKAMQRSFDYFWPRARSLIYAEVKRLAELEYLNAKREVVGRRPRVTYAITSRGRTALADWLGSPPKVFALELEGLLRLYLAPFGTRDDLLASLERVKTEAKTMLAISAEFQKSYLGETSPVMDQVHLRALLNDFLANYAELVRTWAERSIATVGDWTDLSPAGKKDMALATLARLPGRD